MSNDVKVTFTMPQEYLAWAKKVAEREGTTVSHVLRSAIRMDQFLKNEEAAGKKVLIDDGKTFQRLLRVG